MTDYNQCRCEIVRGKQSYLELNDNLGMNSSMEN